MQECVWKAAAAKSERIFIFYVLQKQVALYNTFCISLIYRTLTEHPNYKTEGVAFI